MRHWLMSNTTYGTWLPGDPRGSVTSVRDLRPGEAEELTRLVHNLPGEPVEEPMPGLAHSANMTMRGPPIYFELPHAEAILEQFQETAGYRGYRLLALAVMRNHFHFVLQVPGDPDPKRVLADFKAYGSRKLNTLFGRPRSDTWWTTNGSKRKLPDEAAIQAAINYVLYKQWKPLLVWSRELGRLI